MLKYVIFKTKWGYFGLAGAEYALCRTHLPAAKLDKVKIRLLGNLPGITFDKAYFDALQEQIAAYFEGVCVNFAPDIPVMLDRFTEFQKAVLIASRSVRFGQTTTYGELAKKLGRPAAARAVGNALAKNPLPLIIPCHRVIRSDGLLGGFSALGGLSLKRRLLAQEQKCLRADL